MMEMLRTRREGRARVAVRPRRDSGRVRLRKGFTDVMPWRSTKHWTVINDDDVNVGEDEMMDDGGGYGGGDYESGDDNMLDLDEDGFRR